MVPPFATFVAVYFVKVPAGDLRSCDRHSSSEGEPLGLFHLMSVMVAVAIVVFPFR